MRAIISTVDGIVVLMVGYGCKAWALDNKVQKRENVLERKCLGTVWCEKGVSNKK